MVHYRIIAFWLTFCCFLFQPFFSFSNCAIGGEIRYECIGNNNFEIELIVYTDCYTLCPISIPNTLQLRFFTSGNFPANNVGTNGQISLTKVDESSLRDTTHQHRECGFIPKSVCVNAITYSGIVNLPSRPGGYYLVSEWSRRKVHISNIRQTTPNGPVFTARISQTALTQCNSGSKFRDWYQLYFCLDEEINFDHSVMITDADSLVYEFHHPFFNTWPDPPFNPLRYENGYGLNNLLGSDDRLRIDSETGLITGTPSHSGSFLIGVSVREYLKGQLLGSTFREILFSIGDCGSANADFVIEDFYCLDRRILFDFNENFINSEWIIGELDNPIGISIADNGYFIFPEYGEFDVTRIAYGPFDGCHDTLTQTIILKDEEVGLFVEIERSSCDSDTLDIVVTAKSTYLPLDDLDIELIVRRGNESDTTSLTVHEFHISGFPLFTILLNVLNPELCVVEYFELHATGFVFNDGFTKDYFICDGEVILDGHCVQRNELLDLVWEPEPFEIIEQDFPFDCIIPVVAPDTSTLYVGTLTLEDCIGHFYYNIGVYKEGEKFLQDTFCGRNIYIGDNPFFGFANGFIWRFFQNDLLVGSRIAEFPQMNFPAYGNVMVELIPFQLNGINCPDTIMQEIFLFEPSVDWDIDLIIIECSDSLRLKIVGTQSGKVLGEEHYLFLMDGQDTMLSSVAEFEIIIGLSESIEFTLIVISDRGCFIEKDFNLSTNYNAELEGSVQLLTCSGDTVFLEYPLLDGLEFEWSDTRFFISEENHLPAVVVPDSSFTYELSTYYNGCEYFYTYDILVEFPKMIELEEEIICDNQLLQQLDFSHLSTEDYFKWIVYDEFENLIFSGTNHRPLIDFPDFGSYSFQLFFDSDENNCGSIGLGDVYLIDIEEVGLEIEIINEECHGEEVRLVLYSFINGADAIIDFLTIHWLVIAGDSLNFSDDSLRLRLEGISEVEVFVQMEGNGGCVWRHGKSFNFEFISIPDQEDSLKICKGELIYLWSMAPVDFDIIWSPATGLVGGIAEANPLASPDQSTTYNAEVFSKNCSATHTVYVEVGKSPEIAEVFADPEIIRPGESSLLNVLYEGEDVSISWIPIEHLDNPHVRNPIANPNESTLYTVYLKYEDGCIDSASVWLEVKDISCSPPYIYLPSAFSPNGDGVNDILYVRGENIISMELRIFNRYGQQVFFSDDQNRGWDGFFRGEANPAGVYTYQLIVFCHAGVGYSENGSISLIR